ncbi:MAG: hypothetical protein ABIK79_16690 [Chloroflexota bacterium]
MAKRRRTPRKPTQPLGHIVLPKKGRPYKVIEVLPDVNEDIEETIVKKFIGALQRFEGRYLSTCTRGDPWPDFEAHEGDKRVGIEITQVIDIEHAKYRSVQEDYWERVLDLISDILPRLSGLHITLDDGYQNPPYPPLRTKQGRELALSIANYLRRVVDHLERIPPGRLFRYRWQGGSGACVVGAFGQRLTPPEPAQHVVIKFFGSFPQDVQAKNRLLSDTIQRKMDLHYAEYSEGKLWLLAYEVGSLSVGPPPSPSIQQARDLLGRNSAFDEVWYMFPYAQEDIGAIFRVWP